MKSIVYICRCKQANYNSINHYQMIIETTLCVLICLAAFVVIAASKRNSKLKSKLDCLAQVSVQRIVELPDLHLAITFDAKAAFPIFPLSISEWTFERHIESDRNLCFSIVLQSGQLAYGSIDIDKYCKDFNIKSIEIEEDIYQIVVSIYSQLLSNRLIKYNDILCEKY